MRINRSIVWFVIILAVTNAATFFLASRGNGSREISGTYEQTNMVSAEANTASADAGKAASEAGTAQNNKAAAPGAQDGSTFDYIYREIENETIEYTNDQEAYDQAVKLPDKSFAYLSDDSVYIINGGEITKCSWEGPLDINEHYQEIIQKFIKLYKAKEHLISKDDIIKAGFMPEIIDYGFANIYSDTSENYRALARYYIQKRKTLELEMAKYEAGDSSAQNVEKCYDEYAGSKGELMEYINSITPGDL